MNRKLDRIAELLIISTIILSILITYKDHSIESNLSMITEFLLWIGLYLVQVKLIIPRFLKEKKNKYLFYSVLIFAVSITIGILIKAVHLEEMNYRRYYSARPFLDYIQHFEWWRFKETVTGLLVLFLSSTVYGLLRNTKFPDNRGFKKVLPISFFSIVVIIVVGFISLVLIENFKDYPQIAYKTTTNNVTINFLEATDSLIHFSNIINHEKPKCVLFWAQSCGSQRNNVIELDGIKNKLTDKEVYFIYICGEYDREDDKELWKDFIISEEISGAHIYLKREQFHNLFIDSLLLQDGLQDKNLILISADNEIVHRLDLAIESESELIDKINEL